MGIKAPLEGVCDQSDCLAEITHEVVDTLLEPYYGHITQVRSAGGRNSRLLPERGLHFIYFNMPSSVCSAPFVSIYYLSSSGSGS